MKRIRGIALFISLVASIAFAQEKQAAAPPPMEMPPHPALQQLNVFLGSWECSGKALASDFGPEHATKSTVTIAPELDAHWINIAYTEIKTKESPMAFSGVMHWGYDPGQKMFVAGGVDNMGGYFTQASKGWEGDTMVWEGTGHIMGMNIKSRDTFTRTANGSIIHSGEMEMPKGWQKFGEETCTKKK